MSRSEDSRIQILFVSHNLLERGSPHHFIPAIWLSREGFDVACLCPGSGDHLTQGDGWENIGKLDLHRISTSNRFIRELKLLLSLLRLRISFKGRGIYYVYGSRVCPVALTALAGIRRNQVIYHTQDFLEPRRHRLYEFFERRLAKRAGSVIINEENRARFMKSYYGLAHVPRVVRTYLPAAWAIPDLDADNRAELLASIGAKPTGDEKLIMLQGAYSPVRCSESLLQAAASLGENYYVVFSGMKAGSPAEHQARHSAERHGLGRRAIFLGYRSFTDLLKYTAACDIGVLLYANDGIGNYYQCPGRLTEYLRCGIPVVMSNFPNFEYLALKYRIGVTCNPYDPKSIAKALESLASRSSEQIMKDRNMLKQLALEEFCYENEFPKLRQVVDAAIGSESD